MKRTKKIISLILASTLGMSSIAKCDLDQRRKKHLAIGAYSFLAAYSAKRAWRALWSVLFKALPKQDLFLLFPRFFIRKVSSRATWRMIDWTVYTFNVAKLAAYGFLTYFSIKSIIQELKSKNQRENQKETSPAPVQLST